MMMSKGVVMKPHWMIEIKQGMFIDATNVAMVCIEEDGIRVHLKDGDFMPLIVAPSRERQFIEQLQAINGNDSSDLRDRLSKVKSLRGE